MRALVLHPALPFSEQTRSSEAQLREACNLIEALDLELADAQIAQISSPRAATLFGPGKVDELAERIKQDEIGLVIVNAALTPIQQRNLERDWKAKVLDRTGLILEIFGARAQTREGVMQVELAHLEYQRGRLVRSWTHLERQRGGVGFLGGPGETQIESDRRVLRDRIALLKQRIQKVVRTRSLHRAAREKAPYPVVALVGYTNAGKSTLFNRLTKADVMAKDMLFATLDPTMRAIDLPSGMKAITSDTVGFISDLPTELVAAFKATLEEVLAADVIVHVRDIADEETDAQNMDVLSVLRDLGVTPDTFDAIIEARNKIDLLDTTEREAALNAARRDENAVCVSAVTGEGVEALLELVEAKLKADDLRLEIELPSDQGEALAWLYAHGCVEGRQDENANVRLKLCISQLDRGRYEKRFGAMPERRFSASPD